MAKHVVVGGDPVQGTDTHNVQGFGPNPAAPPPELPFTGTGEFAYDGQLTEQLSDFVTIDGTPVAVTTSRSALKTGETAPPNGKHTGPQGSNFAAQPPGAVPAAPTVDPRLRIVDSPLGTGVPNSAAGSGLLTVGGVPVLLDGDPIDSCGGPSPGVSTVAAQVQDFVSCSE